MGMSSEKASRPRGPNFSKKEQVVLFQAIENFASIIECKKTDQVKQAQKQAAWAKVAEIYNATTTGVSRSVENLIGCYRNVKSKMKKDQSEAKMLLQDPERQEALVNAFEDNGKDWDAISQAMNSPIEVCKSSFGQLQKKAIKEENKRKRKTMCTGGGPPSPNNNDENDSLIKLKKFIEPQIDGLFTIYDGDASLMQQFQNTKPIQERTHPIEISYVDFDKGRMKDCTVALTSSHHTDAEITGNALEDINEAPKTNNFAAAQIDEIESTPSRIEILKKKKAPELDFDAEITGNALEDINEAPKTNNFAAAQIDEIESTPSRIEILKKKKAPELDFVKNTGPRHKKTVNDSFINLSDDKRELVQLQKQQIQLELCHKEEMYLLELEDKKEEIKFNKERRQKELYLLELKIKSMEN